MARTWFSRGLRGMIARRIQGDLFKQGFVVGPHDKFIDGDFGGNTESALKLLQTARALPQSGAVDDATWQQLTVDPLPSLFERTLGLTAAFEAHGFGLLKGNFDGAGLTWGVIGFTLKSGEIQAILREAEATVPGTLARVMGPLAVEWSAITAKSMAEQLTWADAMSSGPNKADVPKPWLDAFAKLGDEPAIKRIEMQRAYDKYFVPAAASARALRLGSELGVAFAFDVHVQNGGFKAVTIALAKSLPPGLPKVERRRALATSVADSANPKWRADVLSRKMTIATGQGVVHGGPYRLASWGLDETLAA